MVETEAPPDLDFLDAVLAGLSAPRRTLPCRFFYDYAGSLLFEQICDLPEYYPTRTEDGILAQHADSILRALPVPLHLVELGSGSSRKTRRLIEASLRRQPELVYTPVDISAEMLRLTAEELSSDYPALSVRPLVGEYTSALRRLRVERGGPRLVLFLGSNLGNFTAEAGVQFLRNIRGMLRPGVDHALVGLDMEKDPAVLHAAYNDAQGVTAAFNLNLLRRINAELEGDFRLDDWEHRAHYNSVLGRIEMHLVSRREQEVYVAGTSYRFARGETIHTENSHKYTPDRIRRLASDAGLAWDRCWSDAAGWFTVNLFSAAGDGERS